MGAEPPNGQRSLLWGVVAGVSYFVLAVASGDIDLVPTDISLDAWHYAKLAEGSVGAEHILSPFRNRMMLPAIAGGLNEIGVPLMLAFAGLGGALIGVTFGLLHRTLRRSYPDRTVLGVLAILFVSGAVMQVVRSPFSADTAVLAASAAVFAALDEDRWLPLVALMPFAVAAHEMNLLLLIPIALVGWRQRKPITGVVAILAVGCWWLLHRSGALVPVNDRSNLLDVQHRREMVEFNSAKYGSVLGAVWAHVVNSLGALFLLAPFGFSKVRQPFRDGAWMLPLCAVLALTASDWGRLFLPCAPVLVACACAALTGGGSPTRPSGDEIANRVADA